MIFFTKATKYLEPIVRQRAELKPASRVGQECDVNEANMATIFQCSDV